MAVAYAQFHWKLQLDLKFFPAVNQGELAVVYSFLFLYIACRGSGKLAGCMTQVSEIFPENEKPTERP